MYVGMSNDDLFIIENHLLVAQTVKINPLILSDLAGTSAMRSWPFQYTVPPLAQVIVYCGTYKASSWDPLSQRILRLALISMQMLKVIPLLLRSSVLALFTPKTVGLIRKALFKSRVLVIRRCTTGVVGQRGALLQGLNLSLVHHALQLHSCLCVKDQYPADLVCLQPV
jgi:hypothetical protein